MKRLNLRSRIHLQLTPEGMHSLRGRSFATASGFRISDLKTTLTKGTAMEALAYRSPETESFGLNPDRDGWVTIELERLIELLSKIDRPLHYIAREFILIDDDEVIDVDSNGRKDSITFELFREEAVDLLNHLVTIEEELDVDTSDTRDMIEDAIDLYEMSK